MLFTQPIFLGFFAIVFGVHWLLPANRERKVFLLVASYVFYGAWDWRFLFLIAASTLINYVAGWAMKGDTPRGVRKLWLVLSVCASLGILGFFKYYNFFVTSACSALSIFGLDTPNLTLRIILPVGISFFTFQSMSYAIDVYRKKLEPVGSLLDFALFVGFFPQLVAGPIVRAADFLPQLKAKRQLSNVSFKGPIALFLIGFLKKACIADNIAPFVDQVYGAPDSFSTSAIWLASLLYSVQVYCDFSGYTDMAIAVARLLDYKLCVNFNFPYFSRNILEVWTRWHISLSSWIRDYVYIPLGGGRGSRLAVFRNVMVAMLLVGLWHGAAWTYVIWGGVNGLAMIAYRLFSGHVPRTHPVRRVTTALAVPLTFYWWTIQLIIFRSESVSQMGVALRSFFLFRVGGAGTLPPGLWALLAALTVVHWVSFKVRFEEKAEQLPGWACSLIFGAAVFLFLLFVQFEYAPFIYFQF